MSPGALAERLARLPVTIEECEIETPSVPAVGFYGDEPRPAGFVTLHGAGREGRGENVSWRAAEQAAFAGACADLVPIGRTTIGDLSAFLARATEDPYHRAAIEGAAIDLALKQGDTNIFVESGRSVTPVSFCWSIHEKDDPVRAVEDLLAVCPTARVKLDAAEAGWPDAVWEALAETGRVVVVDFKRKGSPEAVLLAHRWMPEAWLEDPPLESRALLAASGGAGGTQNGAWSGRVSLDAYVAAAEDLDRPPFPPGAVNVKASRVGGWLEALRVFEAARRRSARAYVGGMFEVGVGRAQARVLASLFCPDDWNDLAPVRPAPDSPYAVSPLPIESDFTGFAPPETDPSIAS